LRSSALIRCGARKQVKKKCRAFAGIIFDVGLFGSCFIIARSLLGVG